MSDDREAIFSRVRGALAPLRERAALPNYDSAIAALRTLSTSGDRAELFAERLKRAGGLVFTDTAALAEHLRAGEWIRGYCDPALWTRFASHLGAGTDFQVEHVFDRTRIDDYAFGITRAVAAIAESGTIVLNDATTSQRLAALAPWVHIAVVERASIFADLSEAVAALGEDRNIVWCTGPSKTADIEGILIEGVHGPGVQVALVV